MSLSPSDDEGAIAVNLHALNPLHHVQRGKKEDLEQSPRRSRSGDRGKLFTTNAVPVFSFARSLRCLWKPFFITRSQSDLICSLSFTRIILLFACRFHVRLRREGL